MAPFSTVAINIYEKRAPRGGQRVTNSVTFQRAGVYHGCQEAGRIREESTPAHLPLNQMKAGWCLARADVGMVPLVFAFR